MSSALFNPGREGVLGGSIGWVTDDIRVMLVKSSYTFVASHKFLADLGVVDNGRSAALGAKTITDGIADAADTSLVAISAVACAALVYFKHTGVNATARLICYVDKSTDGLPVTPSAGQTVNVVHDNGVNKIFKL